MRKQKERKKREAGTTRNKVVRRTSRQPAAAPQSRKQGVSARMRAVRVDHEKKGKMNSRNVRYSNANQARSTDTSRETDVVEGEGNFSSTMARQKNRIRRAWAARAEKTLGNHWFAFPSYRRFAQGQPVLPLATTESLLKGPASTMERDWLSVNGDVGISDSFSW